MSEFVVVDASVAFKWLVHEEFSDTAEALGRSWVSKGTRRVAPYLMLVEVANGLHRRVGQGELSIQDATRLLRQLLASGIELLDQPDLAVRALELASQLNQGAVYDAHYLALAESLGCELWTADQRFYRAVGSGVDNVRWIGDSSAPQ